ncbi:MAG: hypothetical protein IPO27_07785 [Bacteroidetes bacterium]|nr:hypothetical protein [Bacteroidota bacterium]
MVSLLTDASGWGGFYFTTNHVFNLGVGFAADPHVYGRVWFPCIDTFDDKALYDFFIATDSTKKAFCNGMLLDSLLLPNGKRQWHWKMNHPIPTYLACMAVSGYKTYKQTIAGIPVEIAGQIADSNRIKNTFTHLPDVVNAYVDAYGPYPFDKIGYSLVPFNSGAMEHATQITIGSAFIDGTTTYETLWAHELAHMYWGDMATCKTAEDMWLNEGWASFNEAYMTEKVYGLQAYKDHVSATHKYVLQFSHIDDGSYLTMNNIPHAYTYGTTVYRKGADLAHTLRHYLGDSLFKIGAKYYFNNRAYGNASSADFRDDLTTATGVDMTRFFNDWVFTPGFPHFSIDSVVFVPGGLDHYFVYTRQRSKGNNHIYNMPVDITLSNGVDDTTYTIVIDSATNSFHIATLGVFDHFMLDLNEK